MDVTGACGSATVTMTFGFEILDVFLDDAIELENGLANDLVVARGGVTSGRGDNGRVLVGLEKETDETR